MKKDFSYKNFSKQSSAQPLLGRIVKSPWAVLIFLLLCLLGTGFFFVYQKQTIVSSAVRPYFSRVQTWFAERRAHWHQNAVKVKQIAPNKTAEDLPIHFEFYTALPSMHVTISEADSDNNAQQTPVHPPINAEPALTTNEKPVNTAGAKFSADTSSLNTNIVNARELERDLSNQIQQETYVLQVGVFRSAATAERYRQALAQMGLTADIKKLAISAQQVYRVQIGPFSSKGQAKMAQRQLLKKGINGIVRKMEMG